LVFCSLMNTQQLYIQFITPPDFSWMGWLKMWYRACREHRSLSQFRCANTRYTELMVHSSVLSISSLLW
jgi:hypothetical protein